MSDGPKPFPLRVRRFHCPSDISSATPPGVHDVPAPASFRDQGAGAGAQKAEMTERVNKLTSFDVLGDTLAPSALRIRSAGTFGFTVGDLSYKGPVMVVNNAVMMWDCLQFGVGSDVLVKELEGELGGRQRFDDPSSVFHDWTTENFEVFTLVDLMPEILVLGTGANMFLLPPFLREYLNSLGMQVEVMPSEADGVSAFTLEPTKQTMMTDEASPLLLPRVPTSPRPPYDALQAPLSPSSLDGASTIVVEDVGDFVRNDARSGRPSTLRRGLKARHLVMMSVGGTIGTGLFVASGATIAQAGPVGALVAYAVVGCMVFFVLTSLGEMSTLLPVSGSFHDFAGRFVDPALAWTLASELSASGIIMSFWTPSVPPWIWSLIILLGLVIVNTRGVRRFGEVEYWLSLVKVLAVVLFVAVGAVIVFIGFPPEEPGMPREPVGFKNWFIEGAPIKDGLHGVISVVAIAFFGFGGTELVGVSAGEVEDPQKNVPRAINQTFWRILLFYVASIGVIGLLIPNDDPSLPLAAINSDIRIAPFTLVLVRCGLASASHIMNFVILTAVVSASNSAMYAASRTLVSMANDGRAPACLRLTDAQGVPWRAVGVTIGMGSLAFLGIIWGEGVTFEWLLTLTGTSGLLTWMSICVTHIRFRMAFKAQGRSVEDLPYHAPFFPYGDYVALGIGLLIILGQCWVAVNVRPIDFRSLASIFLGIPLFFSLYIWYRFVKNTSFVALKDCDFGTGSPEGDDGNGVGH
ncbi:hypothetical protein HK101_004950 [Irineochytrium annulatum]|nr:hypothetical protein HK101_004950 [Irineochytrium annulatum]